MGDGHTAVSKKGGSQKVSKKGRLQKREVKKREGSQKGRLKKINTNCISNNTSLSDSILNGKSVDNPVKNLNTNEIGKPLVMGNTILIIKKMGEKIYDKNIEKFKDDIVRVEKDKKLKMFSNSHYSNLERITQINFL